MKWMKIAFAVAMFLDCCIAVAMQVFGVKAPWAT